MFRYLVLFFLLLFIFLVLFLFLHRCMQIIRSRNFKSKLFFFCPTLLSLLMLLLTSSLIHFLLDIPVLIEKNYTIETSVYESKGMLSFRMNGRKYYLDYLLPNLVEGQKYAFYYLPHTRIVVKVENIGERKTKVLLP